MASTYTPIATQNGTGSASSVTFSSIPSTYTDLILIVNGATAASTGNPCLRFNGDTGTNYSRTGLSGNGSSASSDRTSSAAQILLISQVYFSTTNNTNLIVQIQNYSNSTTYKTAIAKGGGAGGEAGAYVGLWRNTAAITSMTVLIGGSVNMNVGTTLTLYGIASA